MCNKTDISIYSRHFLIRARRKLLIEVVMIENLLVVLAARVQELIIIQ